ncbi:MAG: transcription initiation protein [Bacteroidia bacterium]|nr:MAG: transcription initiation protein [Bacteroidia bacterium]
MRFMMLMIPAVYQGEKGRQAKADFAPPAEAVERMMKYNEELAKAGVLVSLDGLQPPASGARISFSGGKVRVTDGPFTESKEVLGGYWMINVKSREEAIEWAKRVPADDGDVIEVRQVAEIEDWPEDARNAAKNLVVEEAVRRHGKS